MTGLAAVYPPDDHVLLDLAFTVDTTDPDDVRVRMPVTPHLAGADGGVRAGVVATLVDVVGGSIGTRVLHPDWMATADLSLHLVRPAHGPQLETRGSVLRRGRTTMVVEATVVDLPDDRLPVAWATMTFAVLPRRDGGPALDAPPGPSCTTFGPGTLDRPVTEAVGLTVERPGVVALPVVDYVRNTIGSAQGGVLAVLADVAGVTAVAEALGLPAEAVTTTDLQVTYVATGRVGPIVTSVRTVAADPVAGTGHAVVELRDAGAGDRLTTLVAVGASAR